MRKLLITFIFLIFLVNVSIPFYEYLKGNEYITSIMEYYTKEHTLLVQNEYKKLGTNKFVSLTNDFEPKNKEELLNIYYTILYSGMNKFVFYCTDEYKSCISDIKDITSDNMLLSHMNSFVHVFNSYKSIRTEYKSNGKVTVNVNRVYNTETVEDIRNKVDMLYNELVDKNKSIEENLKTIHDYIVNNSQYDVDYIKNSSTHASNSAYGPLFEGYAICSGYTDLMALFIDKFGLTNYKISTEEHIWNAVYINDQLLHIDVTYDDPIIETGENYLRHDYFLITTEQLESLDKDHEFAKDIYLK